MTSTADQDRIDATSSQLARLERLQAFVPIETRARTIERLRDELDKLTRIEAPDLADMDMDTEEEAHADWLRRFHGEEV